MRVWIVRLMIITEPPSSSGAKERFNSELYVHRRGVGVVFASWGSERGGGLWIRALGGSDIYYLPTYLNAIGRLRNTNNWIYTLN